MIVTIKKRYIILLLAIIPGLYLIISNGQTMKKISAAKNITELNGNYHAGDIVKLNFDNVLYIEYQGLSNGKEKRYAVCSTLEGDVFYVNGLPEQYVLVEIVNENMIKDIETSNNKDYEIIGVVQNCNYDLKDFTDKWEAALNLEKEMVIKQLDHTERFRKNMLNGCYIILFCILLFLLWGGIRSCIFLPHMR